MAIEKKKKEIPKIEAIFVHKYLTDSDWFDVCYQVNNLEHYLSNESMQNLIKDINVKYRKYGKLPSFDDLETDYELNEISTVKKIRNLEYDITNDSFKIQVEKYFKHVRFISSLNFSTLKGNERRYRSCESCFPL